MVHQEGHFGAGRSGGGEPGIRLGFVPLTDAAPLVVAREFGLFTRHGLRVTLSRELGWASVRDKLVHGELDAAHAPCALPFALRLGMGCPITDCAVSMVLNLHGNGITLGTPLRKVGVSDGPSLAAHLRQHRRQRRLVLGIVSHQSTHGWLLKTWLGRFGIAADADCEIAVVPPPQMPNHLAEGHLDGFCAGEPWNSVAESQGHGWCAARSCDIAPGHPEKVVALSGRFASDPEGRHLRLTAALLEACQICADPANHPNIIRVLSHREYLGLPADVIHPALTGHFLTSDRETLLCPGFLRFSGEDANDPSTDKAAWVVQHLFDASVRSRLPPLQLGRIFRSDLFSAAQDLLAAHRRPTDPFPFPTSTLSA